MTAVPVNRWFIRCTTCLAVSAVSETPDTDSWKCGVCQGGIENMGRVERDRLIHEHLAAICDDRCTSARGPLCNCKCGGKHHGSHRVVRVVRDAGPVPTVTPSTGRDQARLNAEEFTRYREAARALLDPLIANKSRGYLPAGEYGRMRTLQAALLKAYEARNHTTRIKALRAVVGQLHAPQAHPVAAVAHATHAAVAAAPPIADEPLALTRTIAPTRATRQSLLF